MTLRPEKLNLFKKLLATVAILGLFLSINLYNDIQVEALSPVEYPNLQLIINNKNWNGTSWIDEGLKPASGWGDWDCNTNSIFNDIQVLGIADYEDGISRRAIENAKIASPDTFNASPFLSSYRNCSEYKNRAEERICNDPIYNPKDVDDIDLLVLGYAVCDAINLFPNIGNPVYAYQYRYNYTFPTNQKEELSEVYRSKTGLDGTYDGVAWTYTYYTYKDSQTNSYIPWQNPNSDNTNNGFLVYGITGQQNQTTESESPTSQTVSEVGDSKRFSCSASEADIPSDAVSISAGGSTYYAGYNQASLNNQNPVIAKFTNGNQDWCNDKYDGGRPPDSKTRGLMSTVNGDLYGVFSVDGGDNNFEFGTGGGWLNSYGSGGGPSISVVSKIDPQTGQAINGTFIRAQLTNGRTNTARITDLSWDNSKNQVIVEARTAFSPLRADRSKMDCGSYSSDGAHPYRIVLSADLSQAVSTTSDTCS
jgi:hypothetical protein